VLDCVKVLLLTSDNKLTQTSIFLDMQ